MLMSSAVAMADMRSLDVRLRATGSECAPPCPRATRARSGGRGTGRGSNASGPRTPAPDQTPLASSSRAITGLIAVCQTTAWAPSRPHVSSLSTTWWRYTSRGEPSVPVPVTHVPAHVLPVIRSPRLIGSGSAAATTSRGETSTPSTRSGSVRSSPSLWRVFRTSMNSSPIPYLNVTRRQSIHLRHEEDLLVLDVHALDGTDPLREREDLRLAERLGREPPAVLLPDDGRVEALLDRGPDREARREVVSLDDQVGAVPDADLVDLAEQLIRGVAGEHVRHARVRRPCRATRGALVPPIGPPARTARPRA